MSGCDEFKPQLWRPNKCQTCFKPKTEHAAAAIEKSQPAAKPVIAKPASIPRKPPSKPKPVSTGSSSNNNNNNNNSNRATRFQLPRRTPTNAPANSASTPAAPSAAPSSSASSSASSTRGVRDHAVSSSLSAILARGRTRPAVTTDAPREDQPAPITHLRRPGVARRRPARRTRFRAFSGSTAQSAAASGSSSTSSTTASSASTTFVPSAASTAAQASSPSDEEAEPAEASALVEVGAAADANENPKNDDISEQAHDKEDDHHDDDDDDNEEDSGDDVSSASAGVAIPVASTRRTLLQGIRQGVQLRATDHHLRRVEERKDNKKSFASELHWGIRARRSRRDKKVIDRVASVIAESKDFEEVRDFFSGNPSMRTLQGARLWLDRATRVENELNAPPAFLSKHFAWPSRQISSLRQVFTFVDQLLHCLDNIEEAAMESKNNLAELSAGQPISTPPLTANVLQENATQIQKLLALCSIVDDSAPTMLRQALEIHSSLDIRDFLIRLWEDADDQYEHEDSKLDLDAITDVELLARRSRAAVHSSLRLLFARALYDFQELSQGRLLQYDLSSWASRTYAMLTECLKLREDALKAGWMNEEEADIDTTDPDVDLLHYQGDAGRVSLHAHASAIRHQLQAKFHRAISVRNRSGQWDRQENIQLRNTRKDSVPSGVGASSSGSTSREVGGSKSSSVTAAQATEVLSAIREHRAEAELKKLLGDFGEADSAMTSRGVVFARCAISYKNLPALRVLLHLLGLQQLKSLAQPIASAELPLPARAANFLEWLHEAVIKSSTEFCDVLLAHGADLNYRSRAGGHTPLHLAARRGELKMMEYLIAMGADPLLRNGLRQSPCEVLSHSKFPAAKRAKVTVRTLPYGSYLNNPNLSDVTLESEDGDSFFVHKIILCAQSPVLKVMMDNGNRWQESNEDTIPLPGVSSKALKFLLQFCYTGNCSYVADEIEVGISLLELSARFLLGDMKRQVEERLLEKVSKHNVLGLYQAAFQWDAPSLLAGAQHYLLANYGKVLSGLKGQAKFDLVYSKRPQEAAEETLKHRTLLHLLANAAEARQRSSSLAR